MILDIAAWAGVILFSSFIIVPIIGSMFNEGRLTTYKEDALTGSVAIGVVLVVGGITFATLWSFSRVLS